jgi:2'-5' RNA ligase
MRLFLAINLPKNIKNALAQELPRFAYLKFRQIPAQNWHITLKFIGEVEEPVLPVIRESIQPIVNQFKRFDLSVKDFGFLNPRIFAIICERSSKLYA